MYYGVVEKDETYLTGYFGNDKKFTKVHVVDKYRKPVCGSRISKDLEFQWNSNRVVREYIECSKCKKKVQEGKVK